MTNAASSNPPVFSATGGDTNIDLNIAAKGTGHVTVLGNSSAGAIQFNCESNSHGQQVKGQPHSAGVTNISLLPAGANSTLVSRVSVDTLTNKTLTTPALTPTATAAGSIVFKEGTNNGTNTATLIGPAATDDVVLTLPASTGTVALTSDIPAASTFGISNTNAVKIDSASVADDEYARFTSSGLESRATSEVLSDIGGQAALTFGIGTGNVPTFAAKRSRR